MKVYDLFSRRQADAAKSGVADVYQYGDIPKTLRVQVALIAVEAVGKVGSRGDNFMTADEDNNLWLQIEKMYLREKGLDGIARGRFAGDRVLAFMRECPTADWLDFLELVALGIQNMADKKSEYERQVWQVSTPGQSAIDEINYRLR